MKDEKPTQARKSPAPAVYRAANILFLLGAVPQRRMLLGEISTKLGIPKSSTLNLLSVLEQTMLVRRTEDGYQLGRALVQLGANYVASVDVVRDFYSACRISAPGDLGALVQLAILDEDLNAVYLAREDCESRLRLGLTAEIGRRVPANCTAAGKALLAGLSTVDFDTRLSHAAELVSLTPESLVTKEALKQSIDTIRQSGRAHDDEETLANLQCIAAAIPTSQIDIPTIAISISAAKHSLTKAKAARISAVLDELVTQMALRC